MEHTDMTVEEINAEIRKVDTDQVSDGFHTFGELYKHRIAIWIALCKQINSGDEYVKSPVWRSQRHSDGELAFGGGWFVLGIFKTPAMQMTYHLPMEYWDMCSFAETIYTAPKWDGHTSDDVLERLQTVL